MAFLATLLVASASVEGSAIEALQYAKLSNGAGNTASNLRFGGLDGNEAQDQLALETPEPASLLLLGSGLIFAASQIRRRARSR